MESGIRIRIRIKIKPWIRIRIKAYADPKHWLEQNLKALFGLFNTYESHSTVPRFTQIQN